MFGDVGDIKDDEKCNNSYCEYIHRLRVKKGDVVELILVDRGKYFNTSNHPIHLHGHYFHVLAVGQVSLSIRL